MKSKKKMFIILISIVCSLIIIVLFFNISTEVEQNVETEREILPEEEIEEEQEKTSKIILFFEDEQSGILVEEKREIEVKELIENPYLTILRLLIKGPQTTNLKSAIPEGTKVNSAMIEGGILKIDLSEQFLNSTGTNAIYAIVNTMWQFNEINGIKITINGESPNNLNEIFVKG